MARFNVTQRASMHVIKVSVGNADEIHFGQGVEMEAGLALSFDWAHPSGPIGIKDDGAVRELDEEGGMANPSDADFVVSRRIVIGMEGFALGLAKHLGDDAVSPEAIRALGPTLRGGKARVVFFGRWRHSEEERVE